MRGIFEFYIISKFYPYYTARWISIDHKENLAKLACSVCLTQHFLQPPPPPPPPPPTKKKEQSERALARKTYAEIFQKLFDSLTLMEMLCHICNRIFKTDTDCHLFLSRDPNIVGPDQTSNRIM